MFNPCVGYCYIRYGKEYTPECDSTCEYAKALKEIEELKKKLQEKEQVLNDDGK